MRPRSHHDLHWPIQVFGNPKRRVPEKVRPAAKEIDRHLDIRVILADRSAPPHLIMGLVLQPHGGPKTHALQPVFPHVEPAVRAHNLRVWRHRIIELHNAAPPEIVVRQTPPVEMDVLAPAVVAAHDGDDGLQRGGPQRRHLKRIIGPPAFPKHAHVAITPILRRNPGDHIDAILHLLVRILILGHAVAVSIATNINADRGIARIGKERMHAFVPHAGTVTATIGDVFQNAGHRGLAGDLRQPQTGGEFCAIWHLDPDSFDDLRHQAGSDTGGFAPGDRGK